MVRLQSSQNDKGDAGLSDDDTIGFALVDEPCWLMGCGVNEIVSNDCDERAMLPVVALACPCQK